MLVNGKEIWLEKMEVEMEDTNKNDDVGGEGQ